jgi:hypothetical protein
MPTFSPVIIGGSGHSGTRIFSEILTLGGVFTGLRNVTKWADSEDLRIINLLSRWVPRYVAGELSDMDLARMRREFAARIRLYFPYRRRPWGFKNPRTMLLLPFLNELFPGMKFVHVMRDGRDIALGNEFAGRARHTDSFLSDDEKGLPAEEKMILFWGRSNQRSMDYAQKNMKGRYLLMRWEELCHDPVPRARELLEFASCKPVDPRSITAMVKKPASIGRWKSFPDPIRSNVDARGREWLQLFGYC